MVAGIGLFLLSLPSFTFGLKHGALRLGADRVLRPAEVDPQDKLESFDVGELGQGIDVVFEVSGKGAFSRFKDDSGVHRVQRVPITESSGRIHTSTSTVAVLPEMDDVDVQIDASDLVIENYTLSLACTLVAAIGIIALFSYTISVAMDEPFRKRFLEMAGLSLGVAGLSFVVGFLVRSVLGVDV